MRMKKRLFIALLSVSALLLGGVLVLTWYLITHQGILLHQILVTGILLGTAGFLCLVGLGILFLVITLWSAGGIHTPQNLMLLAVNSLFPLALSVGSLLGIDREKIRASFIAVNNQLVRTRGVRVKPEEVLILVPHCLQWSECPHKITADVNNCRECGRCPIADLKKLARCYGAHLAVATGGTLARSFVAFYRPKAIVAVACERDLTSGIQDVPLPVMGVLNVRPHGPCFNTKVDVAEVEEHLKTIVESSFSQGVAI